MKNNYLSEREMNVMQVLWKYEKPMTVTEIVESEKELTTPTVHTVLRKLLDKGYVQVIDTVQTGKVFARRYKAKKTQDEEIEEKIRNKFDLTPKGIIEYLGLREPIFTKTTNYGHFGKPELPWEKIIKM